MEDKEVYRIFSKNLNYWLSVNNKTQADLYRKMGVSSATASDWCNEKKIPRVDKLVVIANWLSIELSDLLEKKEYTEQKSQEKDSKSSIALSELERKIIIAYRKADEFDQTTVLRTLHIDDIEKKENTVAG